MGFLSGDESAAKAAVKALTRDISTQMIELTVNAGDWSVRFNAR